MGCSGFATSPNPRIDDCVKCGHSEDRHRPVQVRSTPAVPAIPTKVVQFHRNEFGGLTLRPSPQEDHNG